MSRRTFLPSVLMTCLVAAGFVDLAPPTNAWAGPSVVNPAASARNNVIEIKQRRKSPWFYLPIAPSYLAYDYPYYFSRGHYPTHIAPGYVYYGYRLRTSPRAPIGTGYASPVGR